MLYEYKLKDNILEMERWGNNVINIIRWYMKILCINGSIKFWMFINVELWVDIFGFRIFIRFFDFRKYFYVSVVYKK